jgi:hypothetical protein
MARCPRTLRRLTVSACVAGLCLGMGAAWAQDAASKAFRAEAPNPLDPTAQVPRAAYVSPLAAYRRWGDDKPVPWRQANETVNRIGGWRAYAREAPQAEPPTPAPARPASAPHRH